MKPTYREKSLLDYLFGGSRSTLSNAGSRTDFWDKNRAIFWRDFSWEEFLPRTAFSGKKCRLILSNQVISWYGSRPVGCPLGREFTAKTCSLLGKEGIPPDFERFFLEKRPWKRFWTNVLIRGFMNPLHSLLLGTKFRQVMLLPKFFSRKKLSKKNRSIFGLKNQSCDRRYAGRRTKFAPVEMSRFLRILLRILRSWKFVKWCQGIPSNLVKWTQLIS